MSQLKVRQQCQVEINMPLWLAVSVQVSYHAARLPRMLTICLSLPAQETADTLPSNLNVKLSRIQLAQSISCTRDSCTDVYCDKEVQFSAICIMSTSSMQGACMCT